MPTILDPHSRPSRLGVQKIQKNQWGLIEGSLNSKLPTIWRVEMQMRQAVKSEGRRCTSAKVRREKIHPRQMLERLRNAVFFQWFVCGVSRKVGLLKRRVRSQVLSSEIKIGTPLWRKAHFEVKMHKAPHGSRSTFWSSVMSEKLHAAVAKSTLWSQNVKKLRVWEHFLKFWCRKAARRFGEKHIMKSKCSKNWSLRNTFWSSDVEKLQAAVAKSTVFKSKCTKHLLVFGALFEILMSKNCTQLWRKAHLEVKMLKKL